nr:TetR/AcrR family transcriptional regulator [Luteipulveratus halotolerans]
MPDAGTGERGDRTRGDRASTRAAIKRAGRHQLRTSGPAGVGMRAIARNVGIPPSSLYRFYADRAALLNDLRVDAYKRLIDAIIAGRDAAGSSDPLTCWHAVATAFRRWALAFPDEFGLLYNAPGSGDEPWSPEVYEQRGRAGAVVAQLIADAVHAGQLTRPTEGTSVRQDQPPWTDRTSQHFDPVVIQVAMGAWAALVGHLSIESRRTDLIVDPELHFSEFLAAVTYGMGFDQPGPAER